MILQALKEYYDRKAADPESGIAPFGWEWKEIYYTICIDENAGLVGVERNINEQGKCKRFLVPRSFPRSGPSSFEKTFFLWDHRGYVLGYPTDDPKSAKQHRQWIQAIRKIAEVYPQIPEINLLDKFFMHGVDLKDARYKEILKEPVNRNIMFRVAGCLIFDCPSVRTAYMGYMGKDFQGGVIGRCLVSGENGVIARTHHDVPISVDSKKFISFQADSGYDSYGKKKAYNAPVSEASEFAYTTAINLLLQKGSRQRVSLMDVKANKLLFTAVFWSDKANAMEDEFADFFAEPPKDDPDRLTVNVKALFDSLKTGAFAPDADTTRFFVLGLAPNSARISVRFWWVGTVAELAERLRIYFEDLAIVHGSKDKDHLSLFRLLVSTAQQGKVENINPRLSGELTRAVLEGAAFPETLLRATLIRIKAEQGDVSYPRAKIIKAFINRKVRKTKSTEREITIMLDKENTNIGYRLGRLFATLEKIQEAANPGINATIRDKYYASASSTPAAVFGTLMRLAGNHLSKLGKEKPGWKISLEKLIGEITYKDEDSVGVAKFPAHLKLDDQGQFAIGYYHQRQDFFTKKADSESTTDK